MNNAGSHRLFRPESASRSLGFYIPATAAARAIGLARGILLARLISEHEFGLFQITILTINVLNPLCALGLNEGITRYVPMYETRGTLRPYLRRVVPFIAAVALLTSAILFAAAQPVGRLIYATVPASGGGPGADPEAVATWTGLTRIAAGTTFGIVVYFLLLAILKGLRMFRAVSLLELLNNLLFTLLTIVVACSGRPTAGAMTACGLASVVLLVPLFAFPMRRTIVDTPSRSESRASTSTTSTDEERAAGFIPAHDEIDVPFLASQPSGEVTADATAPIVQLLRFSFWAAVTAVIWQALQYYPMWFLQKTHGPSVTAVFGGVRLITQAVVVGAVTVVAVVQTSVTKTWEAEGHAPADRRLRLAYKATSLLMLVGCVAFAAAAGPIMRLFPRSYGIGVAIVPLCLMFFLISGHLTFLAIHFALIEKMRHLLWPWALGLVGNAVFGLLLVSPRIPPAQALVGAAWAGNLGITAGLLVTVWLLYRERRPIDIGTIVLWAAIYVLALPVWTQLIGTALILLLAAASPAIFTREEKHEIRQFVTERAAILRPRGRTSE
ncbi:MAG: oligosaccharide flippase family protein [Planctomycetes bacterium]|nr:oligosaccharide flippase family protein [Planctomycetota bacterium]